MEDTQTVYAAAANEPVGLTTRNFVRRQIMNTHRPTHWAGNVRKPSKHYKHGGST
jgi:hypothetical protein